MTFLRSVATLLIITILLSLSAYGRNRQAARQSYKKALAYHTRLTDKPEPNRSLNEYSHALFLYRTVIDHDPTYGACDDALYAIAKLYEEMAEKFNNNTYRLRAIHYYKFVAKEYPRTKYRQSALSQADKLKPQPPPKPEKLSSKLKTRLIPQNRL